jgi:hypothetical protein
VAAIGGLLFGYDMGIISGAKTQLQRDLKLSCGQLESVVTMLPIGALVASILGGNLPPGFSSLFFGSHLRNEDILQRP